MKKAKRLKLFSSKIADTIEGRGSFVVFYNSGTGKAVKFETFGPKVCFLASVPLSSKKSLQKDEIEELQNMGFERNNFPFSYGGLLIRLEEVDPALARAIYEKFWSSQQISDFECEELQEISGIDKEVAEKIKRSFGNKIFDLSSKDDFSLQKKCSPGKVVELAEDIFKKVYSFPEDYHLSFDFYPGERKCFMCGRTLVKTESTTNEISIKRAREIGASEEKIKKELEKRISLLKVVHFNKPEDKLGDMIEKIKKEGIIYPQICHTCSSSLPFYPASIEF